MNAEPSSALQLLLESKLDTLEKVEVVLALHAASTALTVGELAVQLQVGRDVLRRVVLEVAAASIVELLDGDAVRLTGRWNAEIGEAAAMYAADRAALMTVMLRISRGRIRGLAARTFAEAFRFHRGDKK